MLVRTPSLFIGHGSPMNAITDNPFAREWRGLGLRVGMPKAILCISAHWETATPEFCIAETPETIHDFHGFPAELHAVQYRAPGAPWLLPRMQALIDEPVVGTERWGLDHGAWQVLLHLFPNADVPIAQLSLARSLDAAQHFDLARRLSALRDEGVMILASGNIVHNLRLLGRGEAPAWATTFDAYVRDALLRGDDAAIVHFDRAGEASRLAVPTREHYLPLIYAMAARFADEAPTFHTEVFDLGSISMRSVSYGIVNQV